MKLLLGIFVASILNHHRVLSSCPLEDFDLTLKGEKCSHETLSRKLDDTYTGCTFAELLGVESELAVISINDSCESIVEDNTLEFQSITEKHYQFDKNYFDGGTEWNDESETEESSVAVDAGRIGRIASNSGNTVIGWPHERIDNFQQCELNVAMCCYIDNRKGKKLVDNTDVCYHDVENSRTSSHLRNGFNVYDGDEKANCNGFAWSDGDISDRYKGNVLFEISMNQFFEYGNVKNIPGAPMCACIEKMPTVSHSDCTKASAIETYTFSFTAGSSPSDSTFWPVSFSSDLSFSQCNNENSLLSHYKDIATDGNAKKLADDHIVDDCEEPTEKFMNSKFYVPGSLPTYVDETKWEKVVGEGFLYSPSNGDEAFRALVGKTAPYNLIRRVCVSCWKSHQDIYYKRLTEIPDDLDFLDLFMNNWADEPNNVLNVDFELFSSIEDAKAGKNRWVFCNYNDKGIGFPRDCGPVGYVPNNWNSYVRGGGVANNHAYYVEIVETSQS